MRQLTMYDALDEKARCEQCKSWLYNACGGVETDIAGYVCNHCLKDLNGSASRQHELK